MIIRFFTFNIKVLKRAAKKGLVHQLPLYLLQGQGLHPLYHLEYDKKTYKVIQQRNLILGHDPEPAR